jgi:hypothetical protein
LNDTWAITTKRHENEPDRPGKIKAKRRISSGSISGLVDQFGNRRCRSNMICDIVVQQVLHQLQRQHRQKMAKTHFGDQHRKYVAKVLELAVMRMYFQHVAEGLRPSIASSSTIRLESSSGRMMSARFLGTSTAVLTEMPMLYRHAAPASLMPSPMKLTTWAVKVGCARVLVQRREFLLAKWCAARTVLASA